MGALGLVFLLAGALPFAAYCSPILAMLPLLPVLDVYGPGAALRVYGTVSLLGLLLSAEPEASLLYLFLGHYPVLRHALNRLPCRPLRLLAKLTVFNAGAGLSYAAAILLFPALSEGPLGLPYFLTLLGLGNLTFLLLDLALGRLEIVYRKQWRKLLKLR